MARIPILKLNNGETNYYPFSVCEATVTTHDIVVEHDVGEYKSGDVIPAVTTIDEIITKMFRGDGGAVIANVIDGITITRNKHGLLTVGTIKQDQVEGLSDSISDAVSHAVSEAESLDQDLQEDIEEQIQELKFSDTDTVTLKDAISTAEAVKMILMKLGMPEENIKIDTSVPEK